MLSLALAFDLVQRVILGMADQVTMDAVTALLGAFITSFAADRVAGNVARGDHPILNGLGENKTSEEKKG